MKIQSIIIIVIFSLSFGLAACGSADDQGGNEGGLINGYDVNLSALMISDGTLTPVFNQAITSYNAEVANSTSSITITATASGNNVYINVNNISVISGSASDPINLNVGSNTINIKVTANDNTTTKTYTVTVTRLEAPSNNANLSGLTFSEGNLTPVFNVDTISYTSQVANSISSITVTPTVSGVGATVKVNDISVISGSASDPINLSIGSNTISIEVTAQDTITKNTYTVVVTRLEAPSNNANLSGLTLSEGDLTPVFNVDTISYTSQVANSISSITVTPTVSGVDATVKVNDNSVISGSASDPINLSVGSNTINIEVTAQDTTTKNTYTVIVTRQAAPIPIYIILGGAIIVDEDGTAIITVKLDSDPKTNAIVTITSEDTNLVTVDTPSTLTFTPDNYTIEQYVTLRGVHDDNSTYEEVVISASNPGSSTVTKTVYTNEDDGHPGPVADTGITLCYNNTSVITCPTSGDFYGQDGNYNDTPNARSFTGPTRYSTTEEYTTKDNITGLVWVTCSEGQTGSTCDGTATTHKWEEAFEACSVRNTQNYAGRSNWRLPTWYELATIVDYGAKSPSINSTYFPNTNSYGYWSSTTFVNSTGAAWTTNFEDGIIYYYAKTYAQYNVRCVSDQL